MILELFVVLLFLSITAIGLGYFTGDSVYAFVGLTFLFILGTYLFTNNVEYQTGSVVNTTYAYTNGSLSVASTNIVYQEQAFTGQNARLFGVLLSVMSGFGMALMFWNYRRTKAGDS
jgi:hypothetical protein